MFMYIIHVYAEIVKNVTLQVITHGIPTIVVMTLQIIPNLSQIHSYNWPQSIDMAGEHSPFKQ